MTYDYGTDEELEKSTNKVMVIGAIMLIGMAAVFPLYRWFEPANRDESREEQLQFLAEEGEADWQLNCASCHGQTGEGGIGPALNSQQFLQSATDDQIETLIAVGIPGSQMSAYSLDHGGVLTSQQIKAITTYIRSWEPDAPDNPDWRAMIDG
jgi:mono/diheme cytochrome c family protein